MLIPKEFRKDIVLLTVIFIVVAPFTQHDWDVAIWRMVGQDIVYGRNKYTTDFHPQLDFSSYPPGWDYFCALAYYAYELVEPNPPASVFDHSYKLNPPLLNLFLKFPLLISHFLVAILIYRIVRERFGEQEKAVFYSRLYLLNPFPVFISFVWGHINEMVVLFYLLAIYALVRDRVFESAFWMSASFTLKLLVAAPLVIILHIFFIRDKKRLAIYVASLSFWIILMSLPYLIANPHAYFEWAIMTHDRVNTVGALGQNWFVALFALSSGHITIHHGRIISIILLAVFFGATIIRAKRIRHYDIERICLVSILFFITGFLAKPVLHSQNFIMIIPLSLILAAFRKDPFDFKLPYMNRRLTVNDFSILLLFSALVAWGPFMFILMLNESLWSLHLAWMYNPQHMPTRVGLLAITATAISVTLLKVFIKLFKSPLDEHPSESDKQEN